MRRMAMVINVRPEALETYRRLHAEPWPEVLEALRRAHHLCVAGSAATRAMSAAQSSPWYSR